MLRRLSTRKKDWDDDEKEDHFIKGIQVSHLTKLVMGLRSFVQFKFANTSLPAMQVRPIPQSECPIG